MEKPTYELLAFKNLRDWAEEDFQFTRKRYCMWTPKVENVVCTEVSEFFGLEQKDYVEYHKKKREFAIIDG